METTDLKFYGFVELYRILKQKFSDYYFDIEYWNDGWFSISKVPYGKTEEGEIILEIANPVHQPSLEEVEKLIDVDSTMIEIRFFVHSADSICFKVNQSDFESEGFIYELKKIIGEIVPARRQSGTWSKDVIVLAKEMIAKSKLSKFLKEEVPG